MPRNKPVYSCGRIFPFNNFNPALQCDELVKQDKV